jgi:predicted DNA-binding transcriptional regulator YafY
VAGTDEIKYWIMTWGAKAEVLAPASLREEVGREAEAILLSYRGGDSKKSTIVSRGSNRT